MFSAWCGRRWWKAASQRNRTLHPASRSTDSGQRCSLRAAFREQPDVRRPTFHSIAVRAFRAAADCRRGRLSRPLASYGSAAFALLVAAVLDWCDRPAALPSRSRHGVRSHGRRIFRSGRVGVRVASHSRLYGTPSAEGRPSVGRSVHRMMAVRQACSVDGIAAVSSFRPLNSTPGSSHSTLKVEHAGTEAAIRCAVAAFGAASPEHA